MKLKLLLPSLLVFIPLHELNSQICFTSTNYPTGDFNTCITTGDFNSDGNQDIITGNYFKDSLLLLLGDGFGAFGLPTVAHTYSPGGARCIISNDFNLDGKVDVAIAEYLISGKVLVIYGNGAGGFPVIDVLPVGSYPFSVCSADFNNDGRPDLATVNTGPHTMSVILANPGGGFYPDVEFPASPFPVAITSGDYNGDLMADIAVANNASGGPDSVWIHLGNGAGSFAFSSRYLAGSGPYGLCSKDFNADGFSDIAVANNNSNTTSVLISQGSTGIFNPSVNYPSGGKPFSVVSEDFDLDGNKDIATANYGPPGPGNSVSIYRGTGSGSFVGPSYFSATFGPWTVVSADFNSDGRPDLATADQSSNNITALINCTTTDILGDQPTSFPITFFPNPGNGIFTLETDPEKTNELEVVDPMGKMILRRKIENSQTVIDLGKKAPGLYFTRLKKDGLAISTGKLIITN